MNKMQIKLTTDNEWEGKYALLEKQFKVDGLPIWALGDLLPTGRPEKTGRNSFFKRKLKEILQEDTGPSDNPEELRFQLNLVYSQFPKEFMENYGDFAEIIVRESRFLQKSELPEIPAIPGNREFNSQVPLDFLADKAGMNRIVYLDELASCRKFILHTTPNIEQDGPVGILWLPYKPENSFKPYLDQVLSAFSDSRSEKIIILTHENPFPEAIGIKRNVKMQATIDEYIEGIRKLNSDVTLFCGHLDVSANPFEYKGVKVQAISGNEAVILDLDDGRYSKNDLSKRL